MSLCAYLAAAVGLPLPAAPPPRQTGEPFPCMDHPCGCRSAEQCWTSCCCFTPEERWSWARARNIQPPAYAERPAATDAGWSRAPLREQAEGKSAPRQGTCCKADKGARADAASGRDCCRASAPRPSEKAPPSRGGVRWVLGLSALHCQGLTTLWLTTGTTLPPPRVVAWAPSESPAGWLHAADDDASLLSRTPPAPPPR